jgi:hypothetical protein
MPGGIAAHMRACIAAAAVATVAAAGTAAASDSPQVVGVAAAVVNDVKLGSATAPRMHAVRPRERVAIADRIETGQRSQLQILLLDRSTFSIGANARLTIDRFVYDPDRLRELGARAAKGAFRFMSGAPAAQRNATIDTPVGSIGIRGTIVDGAVGRDAQAVAFAEPAVQAAMDQARRKPGNYGVAEAATLVVLRGPGPGTEAQLTPGYATVATGGRSFALDRPSLALFVPGGDAAPVGPFVLSRAGVQRLDDLIEPSLAQWRRAHAGHGGLGGLLRLLPTVIDVGVGHDEGGDDDRPRTHN